MLVEFSFLTFVKVNTTQMCTWLAKKTPRRKYRQRTITEQFSLLTSEKVNTTQICPLGDQKKQREVCVCVVEREGEEGRGEPDF